MVNSVYERRRVNLAARLRETGAKQALAIKLDMTAPQISHWLREPDKANARKIAEDSARQIEGALGLTPGELDRDHGALTVTPVQQQPVEAELLTATTRAVILEVGKLRGPAIAEKVAGIVTLAFAHAREHGELDYGYVHQLVKLMN